MAASIAQAGLTCKTYYNAGTYGTPSWTLITLAQDVTLALGKVMAEVKARLSTWTMSVPGQKTCALDLAILGDPSIAAHDVFRDAYVADTVMDMAFADQAIANTGCRYFRADFYVTDFPMGQPLEGVTAVPTKLVLAYSLHVPAFTTV